MMNDRDTNLTGTDEPQRYAGIGRIRYRLRSPLLIVFLLILTGCGGDNGRTPLVVYSPHGRELLQAFERAFEERYPEIDIQWIDMGSQEVLDRVRSERANPQGDIWWGAPASLFQTAAQEGLLEPYTPSWGSSLAAESKDGEGQWHATYITPEVIAYNTEAVTGGEIPRDWDDLLEPRWRDKVLIRDPIASGTMRTIFGMVLDRSLRTTGDTAAGMEWLRQLDQQTREYVPNPTLLYQKLARQEGLVTLWAMPDIDELKARTGFPIDYVLPSSGTPLVVDGVAIIAGSRHPELAREFVEFVGGDEGLIMAAREHFRLPARTDLPPDSLPEWVHDAREQLVPEPLDWDRLQREEAGWMRYWDERVRGRGGR